MGKTQKQAQTRNKDLRKLISDNGTLFWLVAEELKISPTTFSIWMRSELDPDRHKQIEDAIKALAGKS